MIKKERATAAVRLYPSTRKLLRKFAKGSKITLAEMTHRIVSGFIF
ncbi:MAG: hypothetical protein WAV09_00890 [Minisyncoccia bacterium]